jgi:hypothetical protein
MQALCRVVQLVRSVGLLVAPSALLMVARRSSAAATAAQRHALMLRLPVIYVQQPDLPRPAVYSQKPAEQGCCPVSVRFSQMFCNVKALVKCLADQTRREAVCAQTDKLEKGLEGTGPHCINPSGMACAFETHIITLNHQLRSICEG